MSRKYVSLFLIVVAALMAALILPASAQDTTPVIEVSDQVVLDGTVTIAHIYSEGPGFVVIHADGGGGPGADIGHRSINAGHTYGLQVPIDAAAATPTLFAMLHADTGEIGVYEFGTVEGADGPVVVGDQPVTPPFGANVLNAQDQFAPNNAITITSVTAPQASWVVVHSEAEGAPGPVLGQTLVQPGTTANVVVNLSGAATGTVFPMLHVDDGVVGEYEFGAVEGVDSPINVGGRVAVLPVWTVPHVRVDDQIVMGGDGMAAMGEPTLVAKSALSQGPGWLVVHADGGGQPGPVLGFAPLADGWNSHVAVTLTPDGLTPVLFPMLHADTGAAGQYEFQTVEGADPPVLVNEQVVTFPIKAAPSLTMEDQALADNNLWIKSALIDAHGWIAVHSSVDGAPGPVIATYALPKGLSTNILIPVDPAQAASQVFPMLHYDTGAAGVYEFGTVEGADGPVATAGAVVVGPINLTAGETTAPPATAIDANALIDERCTVCHSRERIDAASKDLAGWTATVDRMIGNGAQLSPEEREALIQFLANRDAAAAPPATAIDANALIDERCTVCHSRERIDAASKDAAGWTATIDRMIGNGAQLSPEEREALIQFLSTR